MFDTSSGGHIPTGAEPLDSALRELEEELGIRARPEQLAYAGHFRSQYEAVFYGAPFRDNEYTRVYVYREPVELGDLRLQTEEVEEVRWFDLEAVREEIRRSRARFCVPAENLRILGENGCVTAADAAIALKEFARMLGNSDTLFFYFSGHGSSGSLINSRNTKPALAPFCCFAHKF